MRNRGRIAAVVLLVGFGGLPLAATVKVKTLADGTKVMFNERTGRRPARYPAPSFTAPRADLDELIEEHARRQDLDPDLVRAVVQVESAYRPWAHSHKGAMGLMQLMPATVRQLSVRDPWDPSENLRGGTAYLRQLLNQFDGELALALAGYNAGPESVLRYGGIPPFEETRNYVERILRIYRREPGYSLAASAVPRMGRKTFLVRDENGRYLMTTTPGHDR
jgi:soluble lytic murein transglycosylase-like protein